LGPDKEKYADFVSRRSGHPRYAWLVQGPNAMDPFMDFDKGLYEIDHRPNLYFSEAVGRLNALRAKRILQDKLKNFKSLTFAVSALACSFSEDQRTKFRNAGLDLEKDLDLGNIFKDLQIEARDWSTQIFKDPPSYADKPWEHQAGYSYLAADLSMAVVQELAVNDATLAIGVESIKKYYSTKYSGQVLKFYQTMNATVLDLDLFGGSFEKNLSYVCPRLAEIFADEYLRQ
jgi:hypothetical protein